MTIARFLLALLSDPEGGSMPIQNVGELPEYTASHPISLIENNNSLQYMHVTEVNNDYATKAERPMNRSSRFRERQEILFFSPQSPYQR
jgi:hypothetical protein